jgi:uncharacterized membrane protein (UPF0136 family)
VQFTPQELAMIGVLKRQRDTWPALRVALAVMSLALVTFAAWEFFLSGWSAVPLVLLIVGVGAASHTYRNWHGPIEASLLLKVLEQQDGGPSA